VTWWASVHAATASHGTTPACFWM
jgi:hypothetical protein